MDPLSISAACSSLAFGIVRNGRALAIIYDTFQSAQRSVFLIQTECAVIAAAISQVETLTSKLRLSTCEPQVLEALDLSLTGIALTLSELDKQIAAITDGVSEGMPKMGKSEKAKFVWRQESLNELLRQLQGQSTALILLLKALDSSSTDQTLSILQSGKSTFEQVRSDAQSIRSTNSQDNYPESILEMPSDDTRALHSIELQVLDGNRNAQTHQMNDLDTVHDSVNDHAEDLPRGWQKSFSEQHGRWFYFDSKTQKSQWKRPRPASMSTPPPPPPPPRRSLQDRPSTPAMPKSPISAHSKSETSSPQISISPYNDVLSQQRHRLSVSRLPASPVSLGAKSDRSGSKSPTPFRGDACLQQQVNNLDIDMEPWAINTRSKFELRVEGIRKDYGLAALVVGIVSVDGPPNIYVTGKRRIDRETPVTRSDVFALGISDTITFSMLSILVEQGVLRWEDRIVDLIPAISNRAHLLHHETTLEMLASHKSGLTTNLYSAENGDLLRYLNRSELDGYHGRLAVAIHCLHQPPGNAPGTSFHWNGANSLLIAIAMEEVTKTRFEDLAKSVLFNPLEMYSAGFGWSDRERNNPTNPTQPYPHGDTPKEVLELTPSRGQDNQSMFPCMGLHCSAADFAAYVQFQLRSSMSIATGSLLGQANMKRAHQRLEEEDFPYNPAGFRCFQRDWALKGVTEFFNGNCHGGSLNIRLAPIAGKAYFCFANTSGAIGGKCIDEALCATIRYDCYNQ